MQVLAIIPARQGSKGIKDKNITNIEGFPLLAYSIAAAKMCPYITRIIVSTDSPQYADLARKYGAEVPFLRPGDISTDSSLDIEYLQFSLKQLVETENYLPDYVVLLRPTTPLRKVEIITEAIGKMKRSAEATSVVSISETEMCPYKWAKVSEEGWLKPLFQDMCFDDVNLPRQSFVKTYIPDGYVDVLKPDVIFEGKVYGEKSIPMLIDSGAIDIDSYRDINELKNNGVRNTDIYKYLKKNYEVTECWT